MENDATKGAWFVLQTVTGQEEKALETLVLKRNYDAQQGIDDGIGDVRVPMVKEEKRDKNNKLVVRNKKRYPGYVLIQLRLLDEEGRIRSEVWDLVKGTPGIIGFVGGTKPAALSDQEVAEMLRVEEEAMNSAPKPKVDYKVGDTVRLIGNSAFIGYEGVIESVDSERQRLKVSVNIFGRATPTEIGYEDVERVENE